MSNLQAELHALLADKVPTFLQFFQFLKANCPFQVAGFYPLSWTIDLPFESPLSQNDDYGLNISTEVAGHISEENQTY